MRARHATALLVFGLLFGPALVRPTSAQVGGGSATAPEAEEQPLFVLLEASSLTSPDGVHPVFKPADAESKPARDAARLLEYSYARQALLLHQYVKNYLAHHTGGGIAPAYEPTYLFLGGTGGYADTGFWLDSDRGELVDKRTTSYVGGLAVGEGYLGDFEQLFPHELGHVVLHELAGHQPVTLAAQVHQVTMVTDYFYAFDEGWGEHFQTVAVDHTANSRLQALSERPLPVGEQGVYARLARELRSGCLTCPATLTLPAWNSQRESHLRYAGVKSNLFAYQPAVPDELLRRDDYHAALLYQSIVPPDGSGRLRNGPQMLASEGLIATLFYRLVGDSRLQQTYREPAFYEQFLRSGQTVDWSQSSPSELVSPAENVYLKLFHVFARHVRFDGDPRGASPTVQMLRGYATEYPDEAEALYDVLLETTFGVTVEPRADRMAQDWAAGQLTTSEHQAYLADLHRRLVAGEVEVDSGLAPQIWLRNPAEQVGMGVMDVYRSLPRPYHFNLNAATDADLATVPGVDVWLAREIVQAREERGGFDSVEDLSGIPGVSTAVLDRLRGMQQGMLVWLDEGATSPEDDLSLAPVIRSLAQRLVVELVLALTVAGLIFTGGHFLRRTSLTRLKLERSSTEQTQRKGRIRKRVRTGGWVLLAVVLPVTLFFLVQLVVLGFSGARNVPGLAFAGGVWLVVTLPVLGWRFARGRLDGRAALHDAVWTLLTYVVMFQVVGWLMGA